MSNILHRYIGEFGKGGDLAVADTEEFLDAMIGESDETLIASVLRQWNEKGFTEDEIFQVAALMRRRCRSIASRHKDFVDIVGTGGSKAKTFNVSTAAAFTVAGHGIPVAKHGNKAATSNSGSADVLAELNVDAAATPEAVERNLNEFGICFMFAPNYHRLSPTLGKVRRGLGFPTIFNCVGPLCNPANAPFQIIGVWDRQLVPKMANALARLGTKRSWIVHGSDGLDEITLAGKTYIAQIDGTTMREFEILPSDAGLNEALTENFRAASPAESARLIEDVLNGKYAGEPVQDIVVINAAAAIALTGGADNLKDAVSLARESIRSGKATAKLDALRKEAAK
ncbi:MAG: anthranilate phosphoribosyltransferase [Acidobacteria bacterium]|nr:anthranilate phosphoribosyltransferase [Acidobacteriota bacterium]